jgi:hypothetical protein
MGIVMKVKGFSGRVPLDKNIDKNFLENLVVQCTKFAVNVLN